MRRIVVAVAWVVAAAVPAACGGGGGDAAAEPGPSSSGGGRNAAERKMVVLLTDALLADPSFPADEAGARCFSERLVDQFGVTGLVRLGLSAERLEDGAGIGSSKLEPAQAERFADVMLVCFDFAAGIAAQNPGLGAESVDCLGERLPTDAKFRALLVRLLTGEEVGASEAGAALADAARACVTPEEVAGRGAG